MCFSSELNGKAMFKESVTVAIFKRGGMQEKDPMKQSSNGGGFGFFFGFVLSCFLIRKRGT